MKFNRFQLLKSLGALGIFFLATLIESGMTPAEGQLLRNRCWQKRHCHSAYLICPPCRQVTPCLPLPTCPTPLVPNCSLVSQTHMSTLPSNCINQTCEIEVKNGEIVVTRRCANLNCACQYFIDIEQEDEDEDEEDKLQGFDGAKGERSNQKSETLSHMATIPCEYEVIPAPGRIQLMLQLDDRSYVKLSFGINVGANPVDGAERVCYVCDNGKRMWMIKIKYFERTEERPLIRMPKRIPFRYAYFRFVNENNQLLEERDIPVMEQQGSNEVTLRFDHYEVQLVLILPQDRVNCN